MAGRTVRRFISDLGYTVHTPASVFGRERLDRGLDDEEWLTLVGATGWVVFCRDQHILVRELELQAYLDAKIHMFLFPGEATRQQIVDLLATNLAEIGARAVARRPDVYWLTQMGVVDYRTRAGQAARRRERR
ncbi:hypothetical protein GCM10022251_62400 [Phytohabitans flavus]|uniref:VapC45 PIN like domain-containing protein n=1 Tax=Phytohabitans flavus TaxID=1076124 RepID=A0A6F8Y5N6_9ACTN|nr:hypothetical protein [Phytohabitans flavus]BCB81271.1 hypothetical protein Pflav_076810 [Phytohabitans flavus]